MRTLLHWLTAKPWRQAALALLLLAAGVAGLPQLKFDNTPDAFFLKDDPSLRAYQGFKQDFGSDEFSFIVMEAPARWTPELIERVRGLTRDVARLPDVVRVTSITNARYVKGSAGTLSVGEFIEGNPDEAALAGVRERALAHPFYRDFLVSADGSHLGLLAETTLKPGEVLYKIQLTDKLRELLASPTYAPLKARVIGAPVIDRDVFYLINLESGLFGSLSFVIVAAGFFWMFRSWKAALLPLVVASLATVVAFGYMGWSGAALGLLTPIVPSFLIAVGAASSVFLLSEVFQQVAAGKPVREALDHAVKHTAATSAISVGTTAAALFSFASSDVKPAQDVGIAAGVGLLSSYVFAYLLVPLALNAGKELKVSARAREVLTGRSLAMERLAGWVADRWRLMLCVLALLLVVAAFGVMKLRTDYFYVGLFKESTDIRQSYEHVDRTLRGGAGFEVVFDLSAQGPNAAKSPEVLRAVRELQTRLEQRFPHLGVKTYSAADVVMEVNQALQDGQAAHYRIPDTQRAVAEALLLFESSGNGELDRLMTADGSKLRLNVRAKYRPDSEYQPMFEEVRRFAAEGRPAALREAGIEVTGVVALWSRLTGYLAETEIRTVALSSLVVLAALVLVFRSPVVALVLACCNLVPVALVLAVMGYLDVFLDPFTILVSTIAIGVLDDDTIHFVRSALFHYQREHDMKRALVRASGSAGLAMLVLSGVLVCGFLVYTLSQVASLAKFGAITALAIGLGSVCELLFTPAVLMACQRLGLLRAGRGPAPVVQPEVRT